MIFTTLEVGIPAMENDLQGSFIFGHLPRYTKYVELMC